jgi:hypothetical protein
MTSFEELTKGIANGGMSRRDGLKLAFGGAAFAALSTLGLASAEAAPAKKNICKGIPGNCSVGFTQCSANTNCYCFENVGKTTTFCGCNSFCSSITACSSNSQCSRGSACVDQTGCSCVSGTGFCIPKCSGKNKNCILKAGVNGASTKTAA